MPALRQQPHPDRRLIARLELGDRTLHDLRGPEHRERQSPAGAARCDCLLDRGDREPIDATDAADIDG
jgi:hypothetical protein